MSPFGRFPLLLKVETSFLDGPTAQDVDGALCKSSQKDSEKIAVYQEQNHNWIDSSERAPRIFMGVSRIFFLLDILYIF